MSEPIGRFEIVIKNHSGGSSKGAQKAGVRKLEQGGTVSGSDTTGKVYDDMSAMSSRLKTTSAIGGVMVVKHVVDEVVMHNNSLIEITTGSRESQQRATYKYNTASSYLSSILSGAAAGGLATGNFIGAGIGALAGLGKSVYNSAVRVIKESDRLQKAQTLEDITRQLTWQRETVNGSRYMNATQM